MVVYYYKINKQQSVVKTQRLQDWLISMSQLCVVIKPIELKAVIIERLQSGMVLYKNQV